MVQSSVNASVSSISTVISPVKSSREVTKVIDLSKNRFNALAMITPGQIPG
jgi:hypothetical protein